MFKFIVTQEVFISQQFEFANHRLIERFTVQAWSGSEAIAKAMGLARDPSLGSFTYVQI